MGWGFFKDQPRHLDHMEYHPHGSQAFIPLQPTRYLVVVAGSAADALSPLSNEGLSPADLQRALDGLAGDRPTIVFADLLLAS